MAIDRKSYMAFRTISEAATLLEVPAHVLRFWETKFESVTPLKRGGRRRYHANLLFRFVQKKDTVEAAFEIQICLQ